MSVSERAGLFEVPLVAVWRMHVKCHLQAGRIGGVGVQGTGAECEVTAWTEGVCQGRVKGGAYIREARSPPLKFDPSLPFFP